MVNNIDPSKVEIVRSFAYGIAGTSNTKSTRGWNTFQTTCRDLPELRLWPRGGSPSYRRYKFENTIKYCIFYFEKKKEVLPRPLLFFSNFNMGPNQSRPTGT